MTPAPAAVPHHKSANRKMIDDAGTINQLT
jgi:hypothetical protein